MFYTKSIEETLSTLEVSEKGLSQTEAIKRIEKYGKNQLPEGKKRTLLGIFFEQFKSPIIYILLIAALVSLAIEEFTDASFIIAVLAINALIGTYQEYTAGTRADALKHIVKTFVNVLRDSKRIELASEDITVGDIVFFESGVKVAADIRLLETKELSVNESLLTGESMDVSKNEHYLTSDLDKAVADRKNMLYAGSMISKGRAKGIVTAIGAQTQVGKIAALLASGESSKPPLIVRMEAFSLNIAKIIAFIVFVIIGVGLYQGTPLKEIFFFTVAMAVSTIPEGLPVAITVALSMASASMSKRNVIVRKLSSIEGLGSCTLIASDKTGTMTQNRLSVDVFVTPTGALDRTQTVASEILRSAILCNEASFYEHENEYTFLGDQVDVALAKYALEQDERLLAIAHAAKVIDDLPYEPSNRFSGACYEDEQGYVHYVKGSPEVILEKSTLTEQEKESIRLQVDEWAAKGFRNIALAYQTSENEQLEKEHYHYLGFAAIIDPLREGVSSAVKTAEQAGIKVVMVTGDHPNTAFYIAKELGIATNIEEVIEGVELTRWQERGAKKEEIAHKSVFARVSPEQKQLIVKTFQELGHFVAVTGDGVNDAPALKYANVGISMGKSGTDVARESSDLILTDDSFSSIVNGIEEGRVAYDNIRKVIHLLISTGFAEIVLITLSMLFLLPIPLLPVQLLWLNLVTNGIQDVALGLEKAEPGVLKRKARDPKEPIFNKVMITRVVVGGLYMGIMAFIIFYTLLQFGYSEDSARNATLLLMVLFENVHVFDSRTENHYIWQIDHKKNSFLVMSVIVAQMVHIGTMYFPFMQGVLHVEPVTLGMWSMLFAVALVLVIIMELEKWFRKKSK